MNNELLTTTNYEVLEEEVSSREVGVCYLETEISKSGDKIDREDPVNKYLGYPLWALGDEEIFEFVEFFSDVRGNCVYKHIANENLDWSLVRVPVGDVFLTRVNKRVNPLLEECDFSLLRFSEEIMSYHLNDPRSKYPPELEEFRPTFGEDIANPNLISRFTNDRIEVIDGMHRAVAMALNGRINIKMYLAENTTNG